MNQIPELQRELTLHPVYGTLNSLSGLRAFMETHVFAVWDFMSLLKALQRHITCVEVPWRPSIYPTEVVRFINQIVVGEESDVDLEGKAVSHFELYLKAMEEVGASTAAIHDFLTDLSLERVPASARAFVRSNLEIAQHGHVVEVAASFFYGREKLIPEMFQVIVDVLKRENVSAPTLLYYLERHIEVDGHDHGPLAQRCLEALTRQDPRLLQLAHSSGAKALQMRRELWDSLLEHSR